MSIITNIDKLRLKELEEKKTNTKSLSIDDNGLVSWTSDADKPISTPQQAEFDRKQDVLESGQNIKTINGESLLGNGDVEIDAGDITTDLSLYFDEQTKELRGNLSSFTQKFTWQSGAQEFILNEIPVDIVYINVMGQILYDELEQWQVDTEQKKITILDELQEDDIISIRYTYIITQ